MKNRLGDDSGDRLYFVQTPLLVWALSQDPYDLTLWYTIKAIAGEDKECTLSTDDLATLSMMSVGKVSECRSRLIELGLLRGEVRKDPEYPQPVWHLTVPDIWEINVAWAKKNKSIKAKVDHKALQRSELRALKKSLHQVKEETKEPSPGEGGSPPGEGGSPPGETKKIIYRSNQDPIKINKDPRVDPPPPLQDHKVGGGGVHANGLAKTLNGQPPNSNSNNNGHRPPPDTSAVVRSPISLAMRMLASEWAGDFASGWASLEGDLAGWDDDQVRALLTWLYIWLIEDAGSNRSISAYERADWTQHYERHYASVYAGATNRIGLMKSKVKFKITAPLIDDDVAGLDAAIEERSFA
jgi:hypothetical protein